MLPPSPAHMSTKTKSTKPRVTFTKEGRRISLNNRAWKELGAPNRVTILYNPETDQLAFKAAKDTDSRAFRIRRYGSAVMVSKLSQIKEAVGTLPVGEYRIAKVKDGSVIITLGTSTDLKTTDQT